MAFSEAGNNVVATLRTLDCMRSYFPYGVRGHRIHIQFNHSAGTNGVEAMCLIKRYVHDTGEIELRVTAKGSLANFDNIVKIEHQPDSGSGAISNIAVTYDLDPSLDFAMSNAARTLYGQPFGTKCKPLTLSSYLANGTEETTTTANVWKKISIAGNFAGATGDHIVARVKPNTPADIAVASNVALNPLRCNTKGNTVFKTASDREFRTLKGNLTAASFEIDLSGLDNVSTAVGVNVMLLGATAGTSAQDRTYLEYTAFLTIPAGGPITINSTPNPINQSSGSAATVGAMTVTGKVLKIPISGAAYSGANAFAKVETIYRDQVPA